VAELLALVGAALGVLDVGLELQPATVATITTEKTKNKLRPLRTRLPPEVT
jgi:hypothetical protein